MEEKKKEEKIYEHSIDTNRLIEEKCIKDEEYIIINDIDKIKKMILSRYNMVTIYDFGGEWSNDEDNDWGHWINFIKHKKNLFVKEYKSNGKIKCKKRGILGKSCENCEYSYRKNDTIKCSLEYETCSIDDVINIIKESMKNPHTYIVLFKFKRKKKRNEKKSK